ncbi:hypothetical protein D9M69_519750 [compost metagenome]
MPFLRELGEDVSAREHVVASKRVDQATGGGLLPHHASQERRECDDEEDLRSDESDGVIQNRRNRISNVPIHDFDQVGRSQNVSSERQQCRAATNDDRQDHCTWNPAPRVGHFLSHLTAGFKAVDHKDANQRCANERSPIVALESRTHGVEEHGEIVMALEHEQI